MKKTYLILLLCLVTIIAQAQHVGNISTLTVDYGTFIQNAQVEGEGYWSPDGPPVEHITLLQFRETTVTHVTNTGKSIYFVNSSEYDDTEEILSLEVISDTGIDYLFILDFENKNFRAIYSDGNNYRMTRFTFKNIWKD